MNGSHVHYIIILHFETDLILSTLTIGCTVIPVYRPKHIIVSTLLPPPLARWVCQRLMNKRNKIF